MDIWETRLECLRLALSHDYDPEETLATARAYAEFIEPSGDTVEDAARDSDAKGV